MPAELLEATISDDLEATSLPEEEAAPDDEVETEVEQPEAPSNPYEGKTAEEIDALIAEAAKAAEAKARQSEKDRATALALEEKAKRDREQFARDMEQAQSMANGLAERQIRDRIEAYGRALHKAGEDGDDPPPLDTEWLKGVVASFRSGLRAAETAEWTATANAYFEEQAPDGWEPPRDLFVKAAQAREVYGKDGWLKAILAIAESAGEAKGAAKERQRLAEDGRIKALESKEGKQPGPTGARGGSTPSRDPEAALYAPGVPEAERRKLWAEANPGVPFPVR